MSSIEVKMIRCPACGAINRLPTAELGKGRTPVCGRCKRPLPAAESPPAAGRPVDVTDATFADEVERSSLPVVVDMWAAWCGPCRIVAPVIDELAAQLANRVRFAKLDVDANPATAARFNVRSIPTLLVFKQGREVDRIVGVAPKGQLKQRIERHAA